MKVFFTAFIFITVLFTVNIYAQEVKVGLNTVSEYSCKGNINVGYLENENYVECGNVAGYNSISFRAAEGSYLKSKNVFDSFASAKQYADGFQNAYPAVCGKNEWYVYKSGAAAGFESSVLLGTAAVYATDGETIIFIADMPSYIQISLSDGSFLSTNGTEYRGRFELMKKNGQLTIINNVDIDDYLCSVVPSEMPASWNAEALKAQAVASRTYALYTKDKHIEDGYNLCATSHCQVYKGVSAENELSSAAVRETSGLMLYYDDEIINAVFSASSGGYTSDAADVWGGETVPYLVGIQDGFDTENEVWTRTFTLSDISNMAGNIGSVTSVTLKTGAKSGRVKEMVLNGTGGSKTIQGDSIRSFFSESLKSTRFSFSPDEPVMYNIPSQAQTYENTNSEIINVISDEGIFRISANSVVISDKNGITENKAQSVIDDSFAISVLINEPTETDTNTEFTVETSENEELITTTASSQTITIYGAGNGHGVGLSQYGAKKMAEFGYDFRQILKFYYKGVTIK